MPKSPHRFPASTRGAYLPGVGIAITRANVAEYQRELALRGKPAATAYQVAKVFTNTLPDRDPEPRHVARAAQVMAPKRQAVPA